jgi:hypothetical protein
MPKIVRNLKPGTPEPDSTQEPTDTPYAQLWERDCADVVRAAEDFRVKLARDLEDTLDLAGTSVADWNDVIGERFEMSRETWGVPLDLLQRLGSEPRGDPEHPEAFR